MKSRNNRTSVSFRNNIFENRKCRTPKGQVTEFGSVLCVLILFVFLPLFNLSFIPVRYMVAQGVFSEMSRRLGHCEKFSEAQALMTKEKWWTDILGHFGVNIAKQQLQLIITSGDGTRTTVINGGSKIPDEWLPGGANSATSPCLYTVSLKADCIIAALYQGPFAPAVVSLSANSQWENLSKDPKTVKYFIDE